MDKGDMGGQSANNSSDFVRKLYKMLEDPSYEHIVRWGEGGESFVVLENDKFTKNILPKHFKHSNFASFVRQLNKYDFHKVRQNNEDSTPSPYGANAWEFKHPEFQANKKDSLDNIRRKAPAPRKVTGSVDDAGYSGQQMDLLNGQLTATQQQLQHLSERYQDLAQGHVVLLQQVVQLQKFVKNHDGVMHRVMGFLHSVDQQRRNSVVGNIFAPAPANAEQTPQIDTGPASPLQQASDLLDQFDAQNLSTKELEQLTHTFDLRNDYSTPPSDPSASMAPHAGHSTAYAVGNDLDNMVYPVGHTNGIDPINSEHMHNIPYALPTNGMLPPDDMPDMLSDASTQGGRKKSTTDTPWGPIKPRVLLVEDDKICARIGVKFLQAFDCAIDTARDGLEAVSKVGSSRYDLILMDIIMPHLDGVSATVCIRESHPGIPIIAMTSNIRADDIDMYFRYGMHDVLPKPFTKDGMHRALEKHLSQFKKGAPSNPPLGFQPGPSTMGAPQGFVTPQAPLGLNMSQLTQAQSLKEESSPGKSPATVSSWQNSPNQHPGTSPIGPGGFGGHYNMTPTQPGFSGQSSGGMTPTGMAQRRMAEMPAPGEQDNKRQRMYPPAQGGFPQ